MSTHESSDSSTGDETTRPRSLPVRAWIGAVALGVFALVGVGAWVRLSDAGLSIVRWDPLYGVLPPLGDDDWRSLYAAYAESPQYARLRPTLDAFRALFWPEYAHRLLGRIVFLSLSLPLLSSRVRAVVGAPRVRRLGLIAFAIAVQGAVGWLMVATGLRERPMVQPAMLAAHLVVATTILVALSAELDPVPRPHWRADRRAFALVVLATGTLVLGAFVAGLRAGALYPTFPSFNDTWMPSEAFECRGLACLDRGASMHWWHRMAGYSLAIAVLGMVAPALGGSGAQRRWALRSCAHVVLQVALGAAVVLTRVSVPMAVLHQLNAVALIVTLSALARHAGAC